MNENGNATVINGVKTLKNILPPEGQPVHVLFVGKFPVKESVDAGHYYQGRVGQKLWEMLKRYGIIENKIGYLLHKEFEDDDLPKYGYGMTDIVKRPGKSGDKLAEKDVIEGYARIKRLIKDRDVKIVVFLFKEVLEAILKSKGFSMDGDTIERGFDKSNNKAFFNNAEVFVFPGIGFQQNIQEEQTIMKQLKDKIDELNQKE